MTKIDDQAILAIRTMQGRIVNGYRVAEHFGIVPSTVWKYTCAIEKGFENPKDYNDSLARDQGFKDNSAYGRQRKARTLEFALNKKYKTVKREQKTKRLARFSSLLRQNLGDLCRGPTWLANQVGASKQRINNYLQAYNLPEPELREKIFNLFKAPTKLRELFAK